jgi:DNA-binding SARP family transcriptional activator/tetratricopeptide (TPR) repeat protein
VAGTRHSAGSVCVEMLGGFRVVVGDETIGEAAWPSRRSVELVQLLALAERRTLLREQVIDALWPHLDADAGAANLRKAAHHCRQALGHEDAVVLTGGRVTLFPTAEVSTDVDRFERLSDVALRSGDPQACGEAAAACHGDLLPGALYEEWTSSRREHLRARRVELLRQAGRWEDVVAAEPADEQAYREIMRAALTAGKRHEAIRWYGRLRTNLECELGLAPDAESRSLYEEAVAGFGPTATTFVGREVELARAAAALRSAEEGGSGALVLRGPAGIGKSRLCREIAAAASDRGWVVLSVTAQAGCGPYAAVIEAVDQLLARDRGLLDGLTAQVRSTLAELSALAGPAPPPIAGLSRHMVFGATHRLLMGPEATGVLLVVDDAHLADDGTAEACAQLARAHGPRPLLVLVSHRSEGARLPLTQGMAALERAGRAVAIDLGPMERDEIVALLAASGTSSATGGQIDSSIVDMAQGSPFFALELARGVSGGRGVVVPPSVWDAVTGRFLDLDEATLGMLRRLAVAGGDLDVAGVLALTGMAEPDAFALLDAALDAGALIVAGGRYRFGHDLVRVALAEQVPPHHRIAMHRDAARRLVSGGASPALIAAHWLEGRDPDEATPWLLEAARKAVKVGAFREALRHLDVLLEHDPRQVEALCVRGDALEAIGDRGAPAAFGLAAEVAGEPLSHEIRSKQALAQVKQGDPPGGVRTLEGLQPVTVEGRIAHALAWAGAAVLGFAPHDMGTAKAAEVRRLAIETGDAASLVIASWANAAAAHARGDLWGSVERDLLETASLPELAISVFDGHLCITQRFLYGAKPYPDVIAFADALGAEAERLGAARGRAYAATLRGEAMLLSGRLGEAEEALRLGGRLSREFGGAVGEALALQRRAEVALYSERPAEAEALLNEALAVARECNVGFHLMDRIYGTKINVARDPEAALAVLEDAETSVQGPLETCPGCRITLAVPAAIASARGGDLARLKDWEPAVEMLANVVMRLPAWDAALEEVRGHRARATGEPASGHFAVAAEGFHAIGQPLDEARCAALAANSI